jgi:hypothetical protein
MGLMVWPAAGRIANDSIDDLGVLQADDALVLAAQANSADFAALYERFVDPIY